MAGRYALDHEQTKRLRTALHARWSAFLKNNRSAIEPLVSDYVEARLADTMPEAESVSAWADRAAPLFDAVQRTWFKTQRDMRAFLTPAQQAQLNADAMNTSARLRHVGATLTAWQRGEVKDRAWWQESPHAHGGQEAEHRAGLPPGKTRVDEELLRWDRFVAEFIQRYRLDAAQGDAAHSVLRECKARARDHLNRNRVRIERLEAALSVGGATTDDQRSGIVALYGPIDAIFAELKSRVESIPTTAQTDAATHE